MPFAEKYTGNLELPIAAVFASLSACVAALGLVFFKAVAKLDFIVSDVLSGVNVLLARSLTYETKATLTNDVSCKIAFTAALCAAVPTTNPPEISAFDPVR